MGGQLKVFTVLWLLCKAVFGATLRILPVIRIRGIQIVGT